MAKHNRDLEEAHQDVEPRLHAEALARLVVHVLVQLSNARDGGEAPERDAHHEKLVVRRHPEKRLHEEVAQVDRERLEA